MAEKKDEKDEIGKALEDLSKYTLTPKTLAETVDLLIRKEISTYIWGPPGVGKTDIVRQLAKKYGARVCAIHLPMFDPADLKGIPVKYDKGVKWLPSSYLPQQHETQWDETIEYYFPFAEDVSVYVYDKNDQLVFRKNALFEPDLNTYDINATVVDVKRQVKLASNKVCSGFRVVIAEKAFLFLDELSSAVQQVQNAALSLCQHRVVNEYAVPLGVPVLAAGNREKIDMAHVYPMSFPLANRFCHLRLVPSVSDWIDWAIDAQINSSIIGFIQFKRDAALYKFNPVLLKNGDMGAATPRTWEMLSRIYDPKVDKPIMNAITAGLIGSVMASEFISYAATIAKNLPDAMGLLLGDIEMKNDELSLGEKWGFSSALSNALAEVCKETYDETRKWKDQSDIWKDSINNFFHLIMDHLNKEMIAYTVTSLVNVYKVPVASFDGDAYNKFAKTHRELLAKILH